MGIHQIIDLHYREYNLVLSSQFVHNRVDSLGEPTIKLSVQHLNNSFKNNVPRKLGRQ